MRTLKLAAAAAALLTLAACNQDGGVMAEIEKQEAARQAELDAKAKANADFLAANQAREGVQVTESGLQYEIVRAGDQQKPTPTAEDVVTVHYEGTLPDGTVFDSSYQRGEPTSFPLGQVIPGWTEGVQLMRPGEEFRFVIPPELGYGQRGAGPDIGPNAILVFRVELISFQRPDGTVVR